MPRVAAEAVILRRHVRPAQASALVRAQVRPGRPWDPSYAASDLAEGGLATVFTVGNARGPDRMAFASSVLGRSGRRGLSRRFAEWNAKSGVRLKIGRKFVAIRIRLLGQSVS